MTGGGAGAAVYLAGPTHPEVERVVTDCVFAIATGRWGPRDTVPSVRGGAVRWNVSPATVHQAYQILADRGVLRSESRRGYFVCTGKPVEQLVQHAEILSTLYQEVRALVEARPELSPVGTFRHLGRQAEVDASTRPECAFVECTLAQARRHALEVEARLGIPCRPLVTYDIDPVGWEPWPGLRALLTTGFHAAETAPLGKQAGLMTVSVPLTCSPEEARALSRGVSLLEIVSVNPDQGRLVADDIRRILGEATPRMNVRESSLQVLDAELAMVLGSADDPAPGVAVILSMHLWDALPESWRWTGAVHPYPYRIDPEAWTDVAATVGVPLAT